LRRLADVAEKYRGQVIKITLAERFALVGVNPEDLDRIWQELSLVPGAALGLCVRSTSMTSAWPALRRNWAGRRTEPVIEETNLFELIF
jgi:NAD(P)H-nitrite reductase large subunit